MNFEKDYTRKTSVVEKKAISFVSKVKEDLLKSYESEYCSLLLPEDGDIAKKVSLILKKKNKYTHMVVVGIGGSNLGALAIIEAINGKSQLSKKKVFFADTTDPDKLNSIINSCKGKKFLLVVISKSGTTTESVANFEVLLKQIPLKERKERVIVITDENSKLWVLAKRKGYDSLSIPKKVGGRYSVFSAVGILPLMFAGVKTKELLRGASEAIKTFNKGNVALQGALDLYHNYKKNNKINDVFIFSDDLESLGKWFRQLLGESIGKKHNTKGKQVFTGITPTVSIGSTDLHSVGQLYIGGPRDKFTSFISLKKQTKVVVPKNEDGILKNLQGLSFQEIIGAILRGTMSAYKKNNLPYNHYELEEKSEYELGFFMQTKMFEIMILAHLLDVNAFDQPSVEEYKEETRKLLKKVSR